MRKRHFSLFPAAAAGDANLKQVQEGEGAKNPTFYGP